jgi:hypothetical protein
MDCAKCSVILSVGVTGSDTASSTPAASTEVPLVAGVASCVGGGGSAKSELSNALVEEAICAAADPRAAEASAPAVLFALTAGRVRAVVILKTGLTCATSTCDEGGAREVLLLLLLLLLLLAVPVTILPDLQL